MALSPEIQAFEASVLRPALDEVCASPALQREYSPVRLDEAYCDWSDPIDELVQSLAKAMRRTAGMTLVISNRNTPPGLPEVAGTFVVTAFYREGDRVYASPGVIFWMKFNNKLHAFDHRYDNAIADLPISAITRHHVQNHILTSFDFYKLHAFSEQPMPGPR